MGRFKTHEERAAKRMRKQEEARKLLRERAEALKPKTNHIPFMQTMKKVIFGETK